MGSEFIFPEDNTDDGITSDITEWLDGYYAPDSPWIEDVSKRTRRSKVYQDLLNPAKRAIDATIAPLHYEGTIDSGVYDTEIDTRAIRVNNAQFDGWAITENGWHYRIGKPKVGLFSGLDGVVGFGGRKGQHWFKFRLAKVGYGKASTLEWGDIGGAPTYARGNLSSVTNYLTHTTTGVQQAVEQVTTWADIWPALPTGQIDARWRVDGDHLKEEITLNQAAREDIAANRPPAYFFPGTPLTDLYFGFAFRLDWSDIPKVYRAGIQQDIEQTFVDDGENIAMTDATDRLLSFMPLDDVIVRDAEGNETRQPLRKRFYKDGSDYFLLAGVRCDLLAGMPVGDLIFDPTIDVSVDTGTDDGYRTSVSFANTEGSLYIGDGPGIADASSYFLFGGISGLSGATINAGTTISITVETTSGTPQTLIYADDQAAPGAPTSQATMDARTRTTTSADGDFTGTGVKTVDITGVIQELATSYDPSAILIFWQDDGNAATNYHKLRCYEGSASWGADLHIDYTAGGGASIVPILMAEYRQRKA